MKTIFLLAAALLPTERPLLCRQRRSGKDRGPVLLRARRGRFGARQHLGAMHASRRRDCSLLIVLYSEKESRTGVRSPSRAVNGTCRSYFWNCTTT